MDPEYYGIPVSDLVALDRVMSGWSSEDAIGYLRGLDITLRAILEELTPDIVISEATWAHEIVMAHAARDLGVRWVMPHTVRYPRGRVGAFTDPFEAELADVPGEPLDFARCEAEIRDIEQGARPQYMDANASLRASRGGVAERSRKIAGKVRASLTQRGHDPTVPSIGQYLVSVGDFSRSVRGLTGRKVLDAMATELPTSPYVLMTLHRQPEASVDIRGWKFRDQSRLAESIARELPDGVALVVKEHPDGVGDRGRSFYRRLRSLHNVVLLHPSYPTHRAITSALATASVSGTSSYEAGLLGRPALIAAPVFFQSLPSVTSVQDLDGMRAWVGAVTTRREPIPANQRTNWLRELSNRTVSAVISDVLTDATVTEEGNVRAVAELLLSAASFEPG